ncbi:hypothetical protein M413DRAFT_445533 [Hebeloma cylindrosporum]|uniref:F-box domain-containing protein n=1 Tax=Hebeloma cylindrosporum TaxID=76867 RepID=A0A0C3BYB2_HEBCY|nr:hypothetical protein M413DRAFT_445533 [Hebeloma cylindrosporum h7]
MTTELPYEIWLHIFRFLHPKTIKQLRFVNTLLYDLSLDEYHRITQIGYPSPLNDHAPLRDRGNARRVRVLIIRRGPIYLPKDESSRPRRPRPTSWKSIKAKLSQVRLLVVRHEPETTLDKLLQAVPGLTTLTTLDIYLPYSLDDHSFYWTKLEVIKAGWPIFSVNLTTLSIDMPLEEIHLVLLSHVTLLRLENFSIILYIFFPTSEPNGFLQNTLLPFLSHHSPTLRSLKLKAWEKVDISSTLTGLQRMPCLNSLYISHPFLTLESTSFVGHRKFLETHQSQLQHLTVEFLAPPPSFYIAEEFFNQEWCRVLLPELQSLSFRLLCFMESCDDAAIPYFQRHILTVKFLRIYPMIFSYDQVASILTGPKPGGDQLTALRVLDIQIWCFSPDFLRLLAEQTPRLRSLKLMVSAIGPDKHSELRNRVPEFCDALQSYYFPEWGLYELQIGHLHGSLLPPSLRNQCKVALFRALPKLKEFCGLGPGESWLEEQETETVLTPVLT